VNSSEFNVMNGNHISSFVDRLEQHGYQSIATIATSPRFYNSKLAYDSLGFKKVTFLTEKNSNFHKNKNDDRIFDGDIFTYNINNVKKMLNKNDQPIFQATDHDSVLYHNIPVRKVKTRDGEKYVATVFDLMIANYGVDSGLGGDNVAKSYDDDKPYTPAWQEKITGVSRDKVIKVAREFAENADKTRGRSMIIIGAAMNHWYHMDMNYRGVINMLVMCGCVGKSGGPDRLAALGLCP